MMNKFYKNKKNLNSVRQPSLTLTRWSIDDANLVIYTDACLQNDDHTGARLGFWFTLPGGCHYFATQFAEALKVVIALDIATSGVFGSFRRVLVRTDSAPAVYALDLGACSDTPFFPLRTLTLRAFTISAARRFDLKVQHVAGKNNTTADALSRLPLLRLRRTFPAFHDFDPSLRVLEGTPL